MKTSLLMTPQSLKLWRNRNRFSLAAAAEALDISYSMIRKLESGERPINKRLRLACWAIDQGCRDYDGRKAER